MLSPFEDDPMFIALFNRHGSLLPIMHLYQFIAFIDVPIHIANNYLMSQRDKINDRYLSDSKQHYQILNKLNENSLIIVNTLNKEHGTIHQLMSQDNLPVYIEKVLFIN